MVSKTYPTNMLRQRKQIATRSKINGESNKRVQGDDTTLMTPGMAIETRDTATASRIFALGACIGRATTQAERDTGNAESRPVDRTPNF